MVDKPSFGYTGWREVIAAQEADGSDLQIELIGVCTDICVVSNALIVLPGSNCQSGCRLLCRGNKRGTCCSTSDNEILSGRSYERSINELCVKREDRQA